MSKISVTTIAGLTSGGDANKVKIESGDTLQVESNATVGGTLGVTGATTTAGITSSAAHTVTTSTHANASVFKSTGNTQIMLQDTDASANDQFWGLQNSGGDFNILTCNDDRASGFVTPMTITQAGLVNKPLNVSFNARGSNNAYITTSPVPFPTVTGSGAHNIGNHYNNSNYTFTAPVAGRYFFHAHIGIVRTNGANYAGYPYFQINGSNVMYSYVQFPSSSATYATASLTAIFSLAASDAVRVTYAYASSADYYNGSNESQFSGYLLG